MLTVLYAVCTRNLTYVNTVQKLSILEVFLQIMSSFFWLSKATEREKACVCGQKKDREEGGREERGVIRSPRKVGKEMRMGKNGQN